ncbi:hypothetical protein SAMN04487970_102747 [Paenibacillus tianmuensis]|uniref:Uncharacterized protein n=1 Tax=Paenibacillus tianmuensis TaxID=624147 RepID=A0A1G4SF13_9BACL|nr:hypothetical protein [Paenibacillus tianmuensis]SCW67658.1 hypothetical protein SAMN04487970_102747 [Paenibacillus tianmuensis]
MNRIESADKREGASHIASAGSGANDFVLWREVAMAYASPAVMAGIGGLVTADKGLQIAALTTIGGASALVAWMLGLWLRSLGGKSRWVAGANRVVVTGAFALGGAAFGLFAAWAIPYLFGIVRPFDHAAWLDRIWFDFPLSGTIASTIITWRWRLAVRKNFSFKGEERR